MKSILEFFALLLLLYLLCVQPIHSLPPLHDAPCGDSPLRGRGMPPILRRVRNLVVARMRRARPCDPPVPPKLQRLRAVLVSQLMACAAILVAVGRLVAGCARDAITRAAKCELEAELRRA